ncbi:DUF2326 domain-containing protein [Hyphobacterium sp. SN044]|uniref:ABC-three component system protein n=1 Tax=Hyphobacterium sp. SN044 TaxID=2912575 RepID=UPI001F23CC7D|nr:DUF2326 domain-containing protein [Hyphobacterium sp. SN044]MCF8880367.1 DUF2326 domain-containing protein [Hyphobacterium sp. SN044]
MIFGVSADLPTFRSVSFKSGLNIVLADRTEAAGDKDTTNGVGKTTLIEIIDFCLGGTKSKNEGISSERVQDTTFTLDLSLRGNRVKISRSPAEPNLIYCDGDFSGWPIAPKRCEDGRFALKADQWKTVLGWAFFSLTPAAVGSWKYKPTARSLIPYFIRRGLSAYVSPFKHFANQKTWNIQLSNALLLGLDWTKASKWQELKDQGSALDALRNAIKTGAIDGELSSIGELEAQRAALAKRVAFQTKALQEFRVLEEYRAIERETNDLTRQLHALANANSYDRRRIESYRYSIESERPSDDKRLDALYEEAGVTLPDSVIRTLAEARAFNKQIVENRKRFVEQEIASLEKAISAREFEMEKFAARRQELMAVLQSHGALDEFVKLQDRYSESKQALEATIQRISQVHQMTNRSDEIKVETVELKKSALDDYEERRAIWTKSLNYFSEFSEALYERAGRLVIDIAESGYKFDVEIEGSPSEGIGKMKIFCFDLALISFAMDQGIGIDFLVHDSTIFDGVDSRQRAHAIELAAAESESKNFQYILTMNRDMLPMNDFTSSFDVDDYICMTLTDTNPSGSLLGFRF